MKVFAWITHAVVVLLVAIGAYVVLNSDRLIKEAIEKYGSAYLGTEVTVSSVELSLTEGSGTLRGLRIANPDPFTGPPAFQLGEVRLVIDPAQISSELIVIEQIVVDAANVAVQARGRQTNLQQLLDNLNRETSATEKSEEVGTTSEVRLIIDEFRFANAQASVDSDLLGQASVTIPDVELADIGRQSNGATVGQALHQLLAPIIRRVGQEVARQGIDLEGARDRLEENVRGRVEDRVGGDLRGFADQLRERNP